MNRRCASCGSGTLERAWWRCRCVAGALVAAVLLYRYAPPTEQALLKRMDKGRNRCSEPGCILPAGHKTDFVL